MSGAPDEAGAFPRRDAVPIIQLFARHNNAANLLMVLMILFGIFALIKINTQFFPSIETDTVSVSVTWSGASAEDVEANILDVVEPAVRFLDGVDEVRSTAREGSGTITLEFQEGADMQKGLADVEAAVAAITTLPEDAEEPKVSFRQWRESVARLAVTGPYSEATLKAIAKDVHDGLIDAGIDSVTYTGLRSEELVVSVAERDLRRLGLSIGEVSSAISGNSRDLPSGKLETTVSRQIRALSDAGDPEALKDIEVKAFSSGERVRLGDFAEVEERFDPDDKEGMTRGQRAIELFVERSASADTLATARLMDDYLERVRPTLPPGVEILKYDVRADAVADRIGLLVTNGLQGLVLVIVILFIFLNGRIAFWVAAGIPVAMMTTLGVMYVSGQTLNMMSLFALIMMLGIIVDDAIVVGEHTATRSSMGDDGVNAAITGAGHMTAPVIAASLTTVAAFAPLFLVRGGIGTFIQTLPLVVIAVIFASLIECFLILPGHLAHSLSRARQAGWSMWRWIFASLFVAAALVLLLRPGMGELLAQPWLSRVETGFGALAGLLQTLLIVLAAICLGALVELLFAFAARRRAASTHRRNALRRALDNGFDWFRDRPFNGIVTLAYRWRYVTVALAVASFLMSIGLVQGGRVSFVFFPSPEAETLRARVEFNAGTPRQQVEEAVARLEGALWQASGELSPEKKLIVASFTTIGEAGRSEGDNLAEFRVQLVTSEERDVRTPEIVRAWQEAAPDLAGVKRFAIYEMRGGPPGRDIDIRFRGADAASLKAAAEEAQVALSAFPGVSGAADDLPYGKPELVIRLTPRGAALGFTNEEVGRQVRNALEGAIPRRFAKGDEEVTIRVQRKLREEGTAALRALELRTPDGFYVPLEEVVELSERQGFATIQRVDGKSTVSITADVDLAETNPGAVLAELRSSGAIDRIATEYGVETLFSGRAEERQDAFADLKLGSVLALGVIYILLAWVFGSYLRPVAVMLIIPFGFVGATFGHFAMGFDLTILSLFGLLGLAGILVNDSIILVARLDDRLKAGDNLEEAAIGASRDRLRAVLLTSLTTIAGLAPLLTETSLQAQFLLPMAITMVFGLAFATCLVLFLVPVFIGIGGDIAAIFRFAAGRHAPASAR
ncbi:efflux RND transporter permease subunit [Afifella pfennigii]|uniref:efflux RND transporter permease subunit n=1 Tax=Afifella pfennigii TaxID=209897 RepID=UPI0006912485|nr:efflux RND transporter permease subunit [Afifella pfennigii]